MRSATASERGVVCGTMKNMHRNLSASSLNVEKISAHLWRPLRAAILCIKMSTLFLCVAACGGGCFALIKHLDVLRGVHGVAFRPRV
jgi:hypothetical protein